MLLFFYLVSWLAARLVVRPITGRTTVQDSSFSIQLNKKISIIIRVFILFYLCTFQLYNVKHRSNLLIIASFSITSLFLNCSGPEPEVYLFSYFMNNGEDGLHLAYSEDALTWTALNNNKSLLSPTAGGDKLMRDPCIIKGRDGKFHMVWTVSWNEQGIGYASSKDLIHWSEQQFLPVMAHESNARNCWAPELYYDKKSKL